MLDAFVILMLFQLAGELVAPLVKFPIPGPVLGMVFLLLALFAFPRLHDRVRPASHAMLSNLSLLFVPAGVGVIALSGELSRNALALAVVLVVGTWLTALVTVATFTWLEKRR